MQQVIGTHTHTHLHLSNSMDRVLHRAGGRNRDGREAAICPYPEFHVFFVNGCLMVLAFLYLFLWGGSMEESWK